MTKDEVRNKIANMILDTHENNTEVSIAGALLVTDRILALFDLALAADNARLRAALEQYRILGAGKCTIGKPLVALADAALKETGHDEG